MKSIGFKDRVEWVEVEIPNEDIIRGAGFPALVQTARERGVDVKRFGQSPETLAYWFQGPRIKTGGA